MTNGQVMKKTTQRQSTKRLSCVTFETPGKWLLGNQIKKNKPKTGKLNVELCKLHKYAEETLNK